MIPTLIIERLVSRRKSASVTMNRTLRLNLAIRSIRSWQSRE
jgi:hypothetical protein